MRSVGALLAVALMPWVDARQFPIPQVQAAVSNALTRFAPLDILFKPTSLLAAPPAAVQDKPNAVSLFAVNAAAASSYWLQNIQHQGISAFGPSGFKVWRNVKDYGAKGDGSTDDTAAIQAAIAAGNGCGRGCASSTTTPGLVYFPAGTYIVSSPIFQYYSVNLHGDPTQMPTIKAASNFSGAWVIDSNPYFSANTNWGSTNVFFRQIRNFKIDTTALPASSNIAGVHWPTSQATSLQNMVFQMNSQSGTQHQGVFCESGSAGWLSDLTFNGGNFGLSIGNQQYSIRGITCNGVTTCINQLWDWSFTYAGLNIQNCGTGIDMSAGGSSSQQVGSITLIDSTISNTPVGVKTAFTSSSKPVTAGSLVIENVSINNVGTMVQTNGASVLAGGTKTIAAWGQGNKYTPNGPTRSSSDITANSRPSGLVGGGGRFYTRSKPQYETVAVSSFISARSSGAKGDGRTDDTTSLQNAINSAASQGKILFIDAGTYKVTNTIQVPPGSKIVGEAYSVIMSSGSAFNNINNPRAVVRIGNAGQTGQVEMSDLIITGQGAQAGATMIEYNLSGSGTPSGLWDVHARVGGFTGSNLQVAQCQKIPGNANVNSNCISSYMLFHATPTSSNLYLENNWFWTADHDIDDPNLTQITIYSGRGVLIESANGPTWLWGTGSEHNVFYQFQFANTSNVFAGFLQSETPYYQPYPNSLSPFPVVSSLQDPNFSQSCQGQSGNCAAAWGGRIVNSKNILTYGAGMYSFFNNYDTTCSNAGGPENCQQNMWSLEGTYSNIRFYCLNTIGSVNMIVRNGNAGGNSVIAKASDNINVFNQAIAWLTAESAQSSSSKAQRF